MTPAASKDRPLSRRLAELDAGVQSAAVRVREVGRQHREAVAEAARVKEEVVELFASGDEQAAGKAQARRLKAEAEASGPWPERVAGAERAKQRAEADRVTYVSENLEGLLSERAPDAGEVVAGVEGALEALRAAHGAWHSMAGEVGGLLRLAGRTTERVPSFPQPLEDLVHDARRSGGVAVPPPLPIPAGTVSVVPEHDPDDEIREAARAAIRAAG